MKYLLSRLALQCCHSTRRARLFTLFFILFLPLVVTAFFVLLSAAGGAHEHHEHGMLQRRVTLSSSSSSSDHKDNCIDNAQIENALNCIEFTYAKSSSPIQNNCDSEHWSQMADQCGLFDAGIDGFVLQLVLDGQCIAQTFTRSIRLPVYQKYNICHDLLIIIKSSSSSSSSSLAPSNSPETVLEQCSLEEVDLIDVFTDFRKILLGLATATITTVPAASVYLRNTTQRPMNSYLYSCIVKFIASFFSMSVLVGGIYNVYKEEHCKFFDFDIHVSNLSFIAAGVTEGIEFIFDVGRLVLFFRDPGIIDFYQSARWNSQISAATPTEGTDTKSCKQKGVRKRIQCCAMGLSSLPIASLMFIMWICNLIAQMVGLFRREEEDEGGGINFFLEIINATSALWGFWLVLISIYISLSFSCIGGYYLLRMACPCFNGLSHNIGEDEGIGYYWAQFKLIAVDIPGLISTALISPSSLVFFWTAEFVNDMFPTVATFIIEKALLKQDDDDEHDEHEEKEDIDDNGKLKREEVDHIVSQSLFIPIKMTNKSKDYRHNKYEATGTFKVQREMPLQLDGYLDETTWEDFSDEINYIFESIEPLNQQRRPDKFTKMLCIGIGIIMTLVYWTVIYLLYQWVAKHGITFTSEDENGDYKEVVLHPIDAWLFYTILGASCFVGGFFCFKLCFTPYTIAEAEILTKLVQVCHDHSVSTKRSRDNNDSARMIQFHLVTKNNNVWTWIRYGGLSCAVKGVDSINGIECIISASGPGGEYLRIHDIMIEDFI